MEVVERDCVEGEEARFEADAGDGEAIGDEEGTGAGPASTLRLLEAESRDGSAAEYTCCGSIVACKSSDSREGSWGTMACRGSEE